MAATALHIEDMHLVLHEVQSMRRRYLLALQYTQAM